MSVHTAGPWQWDGKFQVCIPHLDGTTCFRTKVEDARLIAAAPDLLEALEAVRTSLAYLCNQYGAFKADASALEMAHAAIAKATGTA